MLQLPDGLKIRPATPADAEVIVHHRRRMFEDMGYRDEAAEDAMVAAARPVIEAGLHDGSYQGWLVEADGQVVAGGGVTILPFQSNPHDPGSRRAWIQNMYTEPGYRRRGLARQILTVIVAWCEAEGFRAVHLHASDEGRPLYEAAGFRPTSEMRLVLEPKS